MAITIRAVGIFFSATLDDLTTDTLVINVLKAAQTAAKAGKIKNVSDFGFRVAGTTYVSLTDMSATYTGPFTGRDVGNHYPPGEYYLAEDTTTTPAYTVWQYYVLDATGKPIQRGVKFLNDPASIVPAGGTVIWRLVSILGGPNPRPKVLARSLA